MNPGFLDLKNDIPQGPGRRLVIGIDFDNTIIDYGNLFYEAGKALGILQQGDTVKKQDIRRYLVGIGKEQEWTRIQGLVYGEYIRRAAIMPGFLEFAGICSKNGWKILIISHKTRYSVAGQTYDLHRSAREWLEGNHLVGGKEHHAVKGVFFEETRMKKIRRVCSEGCDILIDDLPEVLCHPDLPGSIKKILYDPHGLSDPDPGYTIEGSWDSMPAIIKGMYA